MVFIDNKGVLLKHKFTFCVEFILEFDPLPESSTYSLRPNRHVDMLLYFVLNWAEILVESETQVRTKINTSKNFSVNDFSSTKVTYRERYWRIVDDDAIAKMLSILLFNDRTENNFNSRILFIIYFFTINGLIRSKCQLSWSFCCFRNVTFCCNG